MFVFERLISRDYKKVYYVIHSPNKKFFDFYTQDEDAIMKILSSSDWEKAFFELYTGLWKTNTERLNDDLLEWKIPVLSKCVHLDYEKVSVERQRRVKAGLPSRLMLKK